MADLVGRDDMKRARRVDANQAEIVSALRQAGCSVAILAECGQGIPDLLVGRASVNYVIEVKIPGEGLNDEQRDWHLTWRGESHVVESIEGALVAVGIRRKSARISGATERV